MKKLMLFMVATAVSSLAFSQKMQDKDIPGVVKTSLKKRYPAASSVKWDKEDGNYEASFEMNKHDGSALLDTKGNIIETEEEIAVAKLPSAVAPYVKAHYAGKKIEEASIITDAQGVVTYEAEIKGMDLIFNSKGEFLKEVKKDKESKEDEKD